MSSHPVPLPSLAGVLWRETLPLLCRHLRAGGMSDAQAVELGESLIVACALRYQPRDAGEALNLALRAAESWRRR